MQVKDCDMGAIVNRELKQRVRPVSGFTVHRPVAKQDVKHVAKIIQLLDNRWKIWDALLPNEKNDKEKEVKVIAFAICIYLSLLETIQWLHSSF